MTKLAHQAHNPWRLGLTRLISAMPLTIAPALTSARACNIEIEASLWENTAACQSPSGLMQRVSDLISPHDQASQMYRSQAGPACVHRGCAARRFPLRPTTRRVFLLLGVHEHGDAGHEANSMRSSFQNGWLALPLGPFAALVKVKNPKAPAVKREAEEDWGR
jgi:hypothetical protein